MFGKLLKYDMKAIWRYWWIIAVSTFGMSLVGGISMRFIVSSLSGEPGTITILLTILCFFLFFISILALSLSFFGTEILLFIRFYKNLFTDEAYLTFTLPVTRKQILISKTVNALFWTVLHSILLVISFMLFFTLAVPSSEMANTLSGGVMTLLFYELKTIIDFLGIWSAVYAIEAILFFILYMLFIINLIHMCITIGSVIAKKHKVLASIGIYYACSCVVSIIMYVGMFIVMSAGAGLGALMVEESFGTINSVLSLVFLVVCAIFASLASITYSITQQLIDRKLNLA